MKVILTEDVKKLGKKGEVVEVSDGYARNYVLPKKLGVEANGKNMNDLKLKKANEEKIAQEQLEAAKDFAKVLETKEVLVSIKSGEGEKAFGSVSSKEIAEAAKAQHGLEIDKKKIRKRNNRQREVKVQEAHNRQRRSEGTGSGITGSGEVKVQEAK